MTPWSSRAVTATVAVAGTTLLRFALTGRPGSARFYFGSLGTAALWTAGAAATGRRVPAGRVDGRGAVPVATGAATFSAFYAAAVVARRIPVLETAISGVLRHADVGAAPLVYLTTCANAVGEELFFRGAVYAGAGRHPVVTSTVVYTTATAATGNPALTLGGAAMGLLFAQQRRASGGVRAPMLTHLTWSVLMVRLLPRLFRGASSRKR